MKKEKVLRIRRLKHAHRKETPRKAAGMSRQCIKNFFSPRHSSRTARRKKGRATASGKPRPPLSERAEATEQHEPRAAAASFSQPQAASTSSTARTLLTPIQPHTYGEHYAKRDAKMAEENGNMGNKEVKVNNVFDDTNVNTISLETPRARAARQLAEMAAAAKRATSTEKPDKAPTADRSTLDQQLQEVRRRKHAKYVKQRGEATLQAASTTGTAEYLAWLRAPRAAVKGKLKAAAEEMKQKEEERKRDEATEAAAAARFELIRQGLVDDSVMHLWQERKKEQATRHDKAQRRATVDQLEKEKEKYDLDTEIEERRNIYEVEKALREEKDREQARANIEAIHEAIAESLSSLSTSKLHPPPTERSLKGPHTACRPTPTPRQQPIHPNNPQSRKQQTETRQQAAKKRNDEAANQEVEKASH